MLDKNSDIGGKGNAALRRFGRRLLISISVFILTILFSVAANRVVGAFLYQNVAGEGLVFRPVSEFRLQSAEFDCAVTINALGFRDREFDPKPEGRIIILAVGDSFTYGRGVEADESWPKVLEASLGQLGHDVEVAFNPAGHRVSAELLTPRLLSNGVMETE